MLRVEADLYLNSISRRRDLYFIKSKRNVKKSPIGVVIIYLNQRPTLLMKNG